MSSRTISGWRVPCSSAPGFQAGRYRLISGRALEVLPRLADGAYDLVFCDLDPHSYPDYLVAALRLLRPGGVVIFDNALSRGRVADPACSDLDAVACGTMRAGEDG